MQAITSGDQEPLPGIGLARLLLGAVVAAVMAFSTNHPAQSADAEAIGLELFHCPADTNPSATGAAERCTLDQRPAEANQRLDNASHLMRLVVTSPWAERTPMRLFVGPYYLASITLYRPHSNQPIARGGAVTEQNRQGMTLGGHILPLTLEPGRNTLLLAVAAPGIAQISLDLMGPGDSILAIGGRPMGVAFHLGVLSVLASLALISVALRPGAVSIRLFLFNTLILLQVVIGSGALTQLLPIVPVEPAMAAFVMVVVLRIAVWGWLYQALIEPALPHRFYRLACQSSYLLAAVGILLYAANLLVPARMITLGLVLGVPLIHAVAAFKAKQLPSLLRTALIGSLVVYEILQIAAIAVVTTQSAQSDLPILLLRLTDILIPLFAMGAVVLRNRDADQKLATARQEMVRQETRLAAETRAKEEKRTLIDMLAHEIRNPLATLKLASSGIRRHINGSDRDANRRLHNITEAIDSINWVIERSDFHNRMEEERIAPEWQPVDMDVLIERLCRGDRDLAPIAIDGPPLKVRQTDPELLEVLLSNLIDNARKYSSAPDAIVMSRRDEQAAGVGDWAVTIRNPVSDALKPDGDRIFERYYRHELADRRGGQGLGLHLSRRIAQLLGGELTYHYQNGQAHFDLRIGESPC